MATPGSQTLSVSCPSCGARFHVGSEMDGKRGRCAKCGKVFRLATNSPPAAPPVQVQPLPQAASAPQLVAVHCRVCQTLMYGRLDQVGQPIKCPDCGAQTNVPKPEPAKPKVALAALEGDQYELWGVDEAPSIAEMLAAQPKYITVECRLCQTLLYATEDQVGALLKCPDCGTQNVVPPPEKPAAPPIQASDEFDLEIDPALDPGERPPVPIPPRRPMLYEEEREAELARQAERAARGDTRGPRTDDRGRPIMPRWPLVTRVLPFMISSGVPVRWLALSIGGFIALGVMLLGISMSFSGGFGAIGGMSFLAMGLILLTIWLAAVSSIVITIVTESSEGCDRVERWPANLMSEWIGEFFYMLVAGIVSPLPGWLLGQFVVHDPTQRVLWFLGSVLVCFPVILLSQLDLGSPFGVASARVIASLVRLPLTWLMFYFELAVLAAACVSITIAVAGAAPVLGSLLIPVYVGALLLASRLLGRLGWKLAEALPETS